MFKQDPPRMESTKVTTWRGNGVEFMLTWKDLSVYVKIRNPNFFRRNPQPCKRLINNATGIVRGGSLVVLMGPSGSGKSTLMGALACRNSNDVFWEGDIRINGEPISKRMHQISGFMHQEDLFVGTLSVREHLQLMARLKLGGCKSSRDINRFVDQLITEMGLTNCANTRIGRNGEEKVISGGERKRLSFATEVLTDPLILFCDEPTTGLDSFSAQHLINLMKQMTYRGKTVLCTIHQPSSELFAMFHQLILLTDGRIAFIGDTESALTFFQKHGYVCPENYNPAEIIIRALSSTSKDGDAAKVKRLCDEFSVSETAQQIDDLITSIQDQDSDSKEYLSEMTAIAKR